LYDIGDRIGAGRHEAAGGLACLSCKEGAGLLLGLSERQDVHAVGDLVIVGSAQSLVGAISASERRLAIHVPEPSLSRRKPSWQPGPMRCQYDSRRSFNLRRLVLNFEIGIAGTRTAPVRQRRYGTELGAQGSTNYLVDKPTFQCARGRPATCREPLPHSERKPRSTSIEALPL
jgi:hypothetical protein